MNAIRRALATDVPQIQRVEGAADEQFRQLGMTWVADQGPPPSSTLTSWVEDGTAWVATTAEDQVIGYLAADVVDGTGHVVQVSVDPAHSRRRVGAKLLATFEQWAATRGLQELTLTTFADVPWNALYYRRLGWEVLPVERWGPGLTQIRHRERKSGLDHWPRVVMQKAVGP